MPPTTAAMKAKSDACRAGERRAEDEGDHDHPVDVDPHHRGGFAVERRRAHRLARLGALHEERQRDHQDDRTHDDDHLRDADVHLAWKREPLRPELAVLPAEAVVALELRPEDQLGRVLEEERHPEGRDQRRDSRRRT
jgi:hypothetical protein